MHVLIKSSKNIKNWRQFDRCVRYKECALLNKLEDFPDSILVAGCQRSGTTMLMRILTQTDEIVKFRWSKDEELDAALVLSGLSGYRNVNGRYCFQTTYLNDRFSEYLDHEGYKLIWVLRNPNSVVYSMLHNWRRSSLNALFESCGATLLNETEYKRYSRLGVWAIGKIRRACLSYNAKVLQMLELHRNLPTDRMIIVEYDELIEYPDTVLTSIYDFVGLDFKEKYMDIMHKKSMKKVHRQPRKESELVQQLCMDTYKMGKEVTLNVRQIRKECSESFG